MIASRPPAFSLSTAAARNRESDWSSSLTSMRSAWKTRVAGSIFSRSPLTRATMRESCRVVVIGPRDRSSRIARAILFAIRSSPYSKKIRLSSSAEALATTSAALRPDRDMRMSSGPSRRKENPREGSSSCIDESPRSARIASGVGKPSSSEARSPKFAWAKPTRSPNGASRWRATARASGSRSSARRRTSGPASRRARAWPPAPAVASTKKPPRSGASSSTTSRTRTGVCGALSMLSLSTLFFSRPTSHVRAFDSSS